MNSRCEFPQPSPTNISSLKDSKQRIFRFETEALFSPSTGLVAQLLEKKQGRPHTRKITISMFEM